MGSLPAQSPFAAWLWWHVHEANVWPLKSSIEGLDEQTFEDYQYLCERNYPFRLQYAMQLRDVMKAWAGGEGG